MTRTPENPALLMLTLLAIAPACVLTNDDPDTDATADSTGAMDSSDTGVETSIEPTETETETETVDTGTTGDGGPVVFECGDDLLETLVHTEGNAVDYVFACDLLIADALVVEFGTVIEVEPDIVVGIEGGRLVLKGTAEAPVVMRAADEAMPWVGLHFFGGTEQMSQLDFARIEGAAAATGVSTAAITVGAESFGSGNVSIRDCVIDGNGGYGISATVGVLGLERTTITNSTRPLQVSVDTVGMIGAGNLYEENVENVIEVVGLIEPNGEPKAWHGEGPRYLVEQGITLGGENTFEAGVFVELDGAQAGIASGNGSIIAIGDVDLPVQFRAAEGSEPWSSLFLTSTGNVFENVVFSGGSGASNPFDQNGMVTLDANTGSTVEIRDCVLEGSAGWGIWLGNDGYNDDIATANAFMDNAEGDVRFPE